jgi:hypothetical protein
MRAHDETHNQTHASYDGLMLFHEGGETVRAGLEMFWILKAKGLKDAGGQDRYIRGFCIFLWIERSVSKKMRG